MGATWSQIIPSQREARRQADARVRSSTACARAWRERTLCTWCHRTLHEWALRLPAWLARPPRALARRPAAILAIVIPTFQQWTGMNAIMFCECPLIAGTTTPRDQVL